MKTRLGMRRAAMLALGSVLGAAGCDGDGATTAVGGGGAAVYDLTVGVTSESGTLATISIDLEQASADGGFVTDGGAPDCEILAPGAFGILSVLGTGRIRIGVASFVGFDTPVELARCRFDARSEVAPEDFSTEVVDAAAPDGGPPSPPPVVELTAVEEEGPSASTTTAGVASTTTTLATD